MRAAAAKLPDLGLGFAQLLQQLGVLAIEGEALVQCVEQLAPNLQQQRLQLRLAFFLAELVGVPELIENGHQMKILNVVRQVRPG